MGNRVLLINPTIRPVGIKYLEDKVDLYYAPNGKEETLIKYINDYKINAVITRTEQITKEIINNCPTLKWIGQHGVGLDNIDVQEAKNNGVHIINVPDANFISAAEHTLMLILTLSKNVFKNDHHVRNENWDYREQVFPVEIANKTLFVIGFGRIGRKVSEFAQAFDMNVIFYDPFVSDQNNRSGIEQILTLEEGLEKADFVTLHMPLTDETKGIISKKEFDLMKESAYLINVSRGQLIEQSELVKALKNNKIKGAGLDVLELEPPLKNDPILRSDKVILTPHLAGDTIEAKDRTSLNLSKDIVKALKGESPKNLVK